MEKKQCSRCEEWKEFNKFHKDKHSKDGLYSICKECKKKYKKGERKNGSNTEEFIQKSICKHGWKYNYKLVDYINNVSKIKIICHKHGIFDQSPNHHLNGHGCKKCANELTSIKQRGIPRPYTKNEKHWNWKGGITKKLKKCIDCGKEIKHNNHTNRCRECLNIFCRGENHPAWKGGNYCIDCGKYIPKKNIKRCLDCFTKQNHGKNNAMYGRIGILSNRYYKDKENNICSCCGKDLGRRWSTNVCIDCYKAENTPNYIDGRSYDINDCYCDAWTNKTKEKIKHRDNYKCQNPYCSKKYNLLHVHHINYKKTECNDDNLITLCVSCHIQSNYDREWHECFYKEIIRRKNNG